MKGKFLPFSIKKTFAKLLKTDNCIYKYNPNEYKTIFIHIPKTGGNSIYKALFSKESNGHIRWSQYQKKNRKKFQEFFKFAVVRNPWDRLVSAFFYLKKGGMNSLDKKWAEDNIQEYKTFDEFVKRWINQKNIFSYAHFKPQSYWICDENNKIMVDFIARIETIDEDFLFLSNKIDSKQESLKKLNSVSRLDYRKYYNDKTINIVKNVYKNDIELFGYTF